MFKSKVGFTNFGNAKKSKKILDIFKDIKKKYHTRKDLLLLSLSHKYKDSFKFKDLRKYKRYNSYLLIGMGGSALGAKAIYSFLNFKIKKKFEFFDNLKLLKLRKTKEKKFNIVISKSGNTLETIININTLKNIKNSLFITENKNNYLRQLANQLQTEVFEHRNYIGGRYSVLSETGMLPASLMGLDYKKFKRFDYLIKNKNFKNYLIMNVDYILQNYNKKKTNSIILNYDENSQDLFYWYQQLIAESLGKKSQGILPIVSLMPKDNHSLMQLYLDGSRNNFFTFFRVEDGLERKRINKKYLTNSNKYLYNKTADDILKAQFYATQNIFKKKKIPFRSFVIKKRDEKTLGELFCFFILETIMLGKMLKINPFDQPEVELIKKETSKLLKVGKNNLR